MRKPNQETEDWYKQLTNLQVILAFEDTLEVVAPFSSIAYKLSKHKTIKHQPLFTFFSSMQWQSHQCNQIDEFVLENDTTIFN